VRRTAAKVAVAWVVATAAVAAAAAAGCDDTLPKSYLIEKTRVLGASVEVGGDPAVAEPRPGETAHVTWLVAEPGDPAPLGWAFAACAPRPTREGVPECAGGALTPAFGSTRPPVLDVSVPAADALEGARSLLVLGAICANGTPTFDVASMSATCRATGVDPEQILVSLTIPIALDGETPNRTPTLDDDVIALGDTPWPAPADLAALPLEGCAEGPADPAVPRVAASAGTQKVRVTLSADDREAITITRGDPPVSTATLETLQLSHFATGGNLDRQFSVIEASDTSDPLEVEVDWDPPAAADVSPRGTLIRFHFVLRDLRGATTWTPRTLCAM